MSGSLWHRDRGQVGAADQVDALGPEVAVVTTRSEHDAQRRSTMRNGLIGGVAFLCVAESVGAVRTRVSVTIVGLTVAAVGLVARDGLGFGDRVGQGHALRWRPACEH